MASKQEIEEWFQGFDTDGSGRIDGKELRDVIKAYYEWKKIPADQAKIDADAAEIFKVADLSGDGKISKDEFVTFFMS